MRAFQIFASTVFMVPCVGYADEAWCKGNKKFMTTPRRSMLFSRSIIQTFCTIFGNEFHLGEILYHPLAQFWTCEFFHDRVQSMWKWRRLHHHGCSNGSFQGMLADGVHCCFARPCYSVFHQQTGLHMANATISWSFLTTLSPIVSR